MTPPLLYFAIDTPDVAEALALGRKISPHIDGFKLGLEFLCASGHRGIKHIARLGHPLFLDLKLHDIPTTVVKAVRALCAFEPAILTVHTAGGRAMMEEAKAAVSEHTKLVGVTVLTSLSSDDLKNCGISDPLREQVAKLAKLADVSGLDGIVCSGHEVKSARKAWPTGFFVVPGIRMPHDADNDQKRTVTPSQAGEDGASLLVVGRSISQAPHPEQVARQIKESLTVSLEKPFCESHLADKTSGETSGETSANFAVVS